MGYGGNKGDYNGYLDRLKMERPGFKKKAPITGGVDKETKGYTAVKQHGGQQ